MRNISVLRVHLPAVFAGRIARLGCSPLVCDPSFGEAALEAALGTARLGAALDRGLLQIGQVEEDHWGGSNAGAAAGHVSVVAARGPLM